MGLSSLATGGKVLLAVGLATTILLSTCFNAFSYLASDAFRLECSRNAVTPAATTAAPAAAKMVVDWDIAGWDGVTRMR
jgi:hypothetical protein